MLIVDETAEYAGELPADVQRASLQPLYEHRMFIVIFVLSAILSALVLTYVYSERYRAETTIFFRSSEVTRLASHATMALGSPLPTLPYKVVTQTIDGLVGSDQLLRRVVTDLHLDAVEPQDYSGPWYISDYKKLRDQLSGYASDAWQIVRFGRIIDEDPVMKAITDLRKQVKVRNDDSYVYTLQVTAKAPQRAVAIADDVGLALIDLIRHDEQNSGQEEIDKIAALRNDKLENVKDVGTQIRDLLASVQIASIKEEVEKLTALSSLLQQERATTTADLRQSEAKLAGLTEKLRLPNAEAASTESDGAMVRRPNRLAIDDYTKLTTDKYAAEINTGGLRARVDATDRSLAALTRRLQVLNRVQAEHDLLSAQLASAKRDYSALTDAYQELMIQVAGGQNELRIQARASTPALPISPIKVYHVAAAAFMAIFLAIGLAYVLDYLQIRVFLPPTGGSRRQDWSPTRAPGQAKAAAHVDAD